MVAIAVCACVRKFVDHQHTSTPAPPFASRVPHVMSPLRRSDPPAAATSTVALWQELQRRVSACVDATKEDARRAKGQARRVELVEQGAALRARVTELRRVLHAIPSVSEQLLQLRPTIAREGWRCLAVPVLPYGPCARPSRVALVLCVRSARPLMQLLAYLSRACNHSNLRYIFVALRQHEVEAVLEARRQLTAAQDALDTCEAELEFVEGDLATTG